MNPEVEKWHIGNMSYLVDRARTYLNLYNRYGKVSDGTKEYFFIANELWATAVFIKNVFLSKNGSIPSELKKLLRISNHSLLAQSHQAMIILRRIKL